MYLVSDLDNTCEIVDLIILTLILSAISNSAFSSSITLEILPTIPPAVTTVSPLVNFEIISLCSATLFCWGLINKK